MIKISSHACIQGFYFTFISFINLAEKKKILNAKGQMIEPHKTEW